MIENVQKQANSNQSFEEDKESQVDYESKNKLTNINFLAENLSAI